MSVRKRWKWGLLTLLFIAAVVLCVGIYRYQNERQRIGLTAEDTVARYMELWQEKNYDAMLRMWYPPVQKEEEQGMILWYQEQEIVGIVNIGQDETYADIDLSRYEPYDQVALRVTYQVMSNGGSYEEKYTYILMQPSEDEAWYIVDGGWGP